MKRNKRLKSQKYNRYLSINPIKTDKVNFAYETDRYHYLKKLYEKMIGDTYQNEAVDKGGYMNLQDIACSKGAFEKFANYFQRQYENRRKEEMKKEEQIIENSSKIDIQIAKKMTGVDENSSNEEIIESIVNVMEEMIEVNNENKEDGELKRNVEVIQKEALELMLGRNEKYGDSWKVLTIQSLANLCEMKLHRIARLGDMEAKTEDELIDVLNYCVFGLMKLKEQKK